MMAIDVSVSGEGFFVVGDDPPDPVERERVPCSLGLHCGRERDEKCSLDGGS